MFKTRKLNIDGLEPIDNAKEVKTTLKLIYDRVEIFKNSIFFVANHGETFKAVNKDGVEIGKTDFRELITTDNYLYATTTNGYGVENYARFRLLENGTLLIDDGTVFGYGFTEYEVLPNGSMIVTIYRAKALIGKNGEYLLPVLYNTLKVNKVNSDNSVILYYRMCNKDKAVEEGTIKVSADGNSVDKYFQTAINDVLSIVYMPSTETNKMLKRLNLGLEEARTYSKCALSIGGCQIGKAYDEILRAKEMADVGFIKVVDYVNDESTNKRTLATVGVIDTSGNELIPTKYFTDVKILRRDIFVCKSLQGMYAVNIKGKWIDCDYTMAEFLEMDSIPIIRMRLLDTKTEQYMIGYYGNDGHFYQRISHAVKIYGYRPSWKEIYETGDRKFRIRVYGEYYYVDEYYNSLRPKERAKLEQSKKEDWIEIRDYGNSLIC